MPPRCPPHLEAANTATSDSFCPPPGTPLWRILSLGLVLLTQARLLPPAGGTGPQIEAAKDVWRELKLSFELCQATEKALIAQIVESIDQIYLRALLNRTTGQYSSDIRAVLLHLFATHGKITPQQVKAKEMSTFNMHYDISLPVDTVFNTIDDLADLAEHALSPMTSQQMMDMVYVIFARQPILQQDLRLWNRRPPAERTWANMLTHFREAQSDLSSLPTAGDIFHQQPAHQVNTVATMADLVAQRLLDALPPDAPPPVALPTDAANAAFQQRDSALAAREAALLTQMSEMMSLLRTGSSSGGSSLMNAVVVVVDVLLLPVLVRNADRMVLVPIPLLSAIIR